MNKKILLALLVSACAYGSNDAATVPAAAGVSAAAGGASATAQPVRYDFDAIAGNPNQLNAFDQGQLQALQAQLTYVKTGRGKGFGAFDRKLATLQGYVDQRLAGQVLAIAVTAIPMMTRPAAKVQAIDMFSVTQEALLAAGSAVQANFKDQLEALKAVPNGSYTTQAHTKATADRWLAWLAAQTK